MGMLETLLALIALQVGFSTCEQWLPSNFPNPTDPRDFKACNVTNTSYICDTIQILTQHELKYLNDLIVREVSKTKCWCSEQTCMEDNYLGPRIGIALLQTVDPALSGETRVTNSDSHETLRFAELLNSQWAFTKCNSDITIVYESDSNIHMTYVGSTLKNNLTSLLVGEISNEAGKKISRQLGIFNGLEYLIENYYHVLQGLYTPKFRGGFNFEPRVGERKGENSGAVVSGSMCTIFLSLIYIAMIQL